MTRADAKSPEYPDIVKYKYGPISAENVDGIHDDVLENGLKAL